MEMHIRRKAKLFRALAMGLVSLGCLFAGTTGERVGAAPSEYARPNPASQPAKPYIVLRVVGSALKNAQGETLGRIEVVLINTASGQIDFALVTSHPPSGDLLTPVPAQLMNYTWDQSQAGGVAGANQVFTANLERSTLAKAPKVQRGKVNGMIQDWQRQAMAFFSVGETAMGGGPALAPEPISGEGESAEYGMGYAYPPVIQNFGGNVSGGYAPTVIFGSNSVPTGSTSGTGMVSDNGSSTSGTTTSGTMASGTSSSQSTAPLTTLRPSPGGAFSIPFPEGTTGLKPPPARFGAFAGIVPDGSIKLQSPPARFGPFVTLTPQGTTGFQTAPTRFGAFGISAPQGQVFPPVVPRLPSIALPPPIPMSAFPGPAGGAIAPPPSILAPSIPRGGISPPPPIPPPR